MGRFLRSWCIPARAGVAVKRLRGDKAEPYPIVPCPMVMLREGLAMGDRRKEITDNLEVFLRELPNLLPMHRDKFALLRHKKIVGYYETVTDAVSAANTLYPDQIYSVQQVTNTAADAGFYSHAVPLGTS